MKFGTLRQDARHTSILLHFICRFPEPDCSMERFALIHRLTFQHLDDAPEESSGIFVDRVRSLLPFLSWNKSSCWHLLRQEYHWKASSSCQPPVFGCYSHWLTLYVNKHQNKTLKPLFLEGKSGCSVIYRMGQMPECRSSLSQKPQRQTDWILKNISNIFWSCVWTQRCQMKNWQNMPPGIQKSRRSVNKKYSKVLSIPGIWQDAGAMLVGTPKHIVLTFQAVLMQME